VTALWVAIMVVAAIGALLALALLVASR